MAVGAGERELITLTWLAMMFGIVVTLGFGLWVGFATYEVSYSSFYGSYLSTSQLSAGYIAGVVIFSLGCLGSFIMGIVLLTKRWGPELDAERGYIIAFGVITLLCAFIIVSTIMGIIMLVKIANLRRALGNDYGPPSLYPPAPPPAAPPVPPQGNG